MVCVCGHNKLRHLTYRDDYPNRNLGSCLGDPFTSAKKTACGCDRYEKRITKETKGCVEK